MSAALRSKGYPPSHEAVIIMAVTNMSERRRLRLASQYNYIHNYGYVDEHDITRR